MPVVGGSPQQGPVIPQGMTAPVQFSGGGGGLSPIPLQQPQQPQRPYTDPYEMAAYQASLGNASNMQSMAMNAMLQQGQTQQQQAFAAQQAELNRQFESGQAATQRAFVTQQDLRKYGEMETERQHSEKMARLAEEANKRYLEEQAKTQGQAQQVALVRAQLAAAPELARQHQRELLTNQIRAYQQSLIKSPKSPDAIARDINGIVDSYAAGLIRNAADLPKEADMLYEQYGITSDVAQKFGLTTDVASTAKRAADMQGALGALDASAGGLGQQMGSLGVARSLDLSKIDPGTQKAIAQAISMVDALGMRDVSEGAAREQASYDLKMAMAKSMQSRERFSQNLSSALLPMTGGDLLELNEGMIPTGKELLRLDTLTSVTADTIASQIEAGFYDTAPTSEAEYEKAKNLFLDTFSDTYWSGFKNPQTGDNFFGDVSATVLRKGGAGFATEEALGDPDTLGIVGVGNYLAADKFRNYLGALDPNSRLGKALASRPWMGSLFSDAANQAKTEADQLLEPFRASKQVDDLLGRITAGDPELLFQDPKQRQAFMDEAAGGYIRRAQEAAKKHLPMGYADYAVVGSAFDELAGKTYPELAGGAPVSIAAIKELRKKSAAERNLKVQNYVRGMAPEEKGINYLESQFGPSTGVPLGGYYGKEAPPIMGALPAAPAQQASTGAQQAPATSPPPQTPPAAKKWKSIEELALEQNPYTPQQQPGVVGGQ